MDSAFVDQKRAQIYGKTSAISGVRTEKDLDSFLRNYYVSETSGMIRQRVFNGYRMFNGITSANREILSNVVGIILTPFAAFDYRSVIKKLDEGKLSEKLELSKFMIREQLKKVFPGSPLTISFDEGEFAPFYNQKRTSVRIFFDYLVADDSGVYDPIDFTWSNGVVKFNDAANVAVSIFIPFSYLRAEIQCGFSYSAHETGKQIDSISISEAFDEAKKNIVNDFVCAIIAGLYQDRNREALMGQVKAFLSTCNQFLSGSIPPLMNDATDEEKVKWEHDVLRPAFQSTYDRFFNESKMAYAPMPSLNSFFQKILYPFDSVQIDPYDLYDIMLGISDVEVDMMLKKLNASVTGIEGPGYDESVCASIEYLEHTFNNDGADVIALSIHTLRTLPIVLLSVFIFGKGSKYANYVRYAAVVKDWLRTMANYGQSSIVAKVALNMEVTIAKYLEIGDALSNPNLITVLPLICDRIFRGGIYAQGGQA